MFKRALNFFVTFYHSLPKFKNSLYSFLKIFYEKSAKTTSTLLRLGIVYKNSKWSDFKIQNLKTNFTTFFSKGYSIIVLILLFSLGYFVNWIYFFNNVVYVIYIIIIQFIYDYIHYSIAIVASLFYFLREYFVSLIAACFNNLNKEALIAMSKNKNKNKIIKFYFQRNKAFKNFRNFKKTYSSLKFVKRVYSSAGKIAKIKLYEYCQNCKSNANSNTYLTLNTKNVSFQQDFNFYVSNLNKSHMLTFDNSFNNTKTHSLKTLKNKDINVFSFYYKSISLTQIIELSKQIRWLTRNMLVSDKFIFSSNLFTQFKNLFGTNLYNSDFTNKNVWSSTNLSKTYNPQLLAQFFNNNGKFNIMYNVDKFDLSQLWLLKKIYFNSTNLSSNSSLVYTKNLCIPTKSNTNLVKLNNTSTSFNSNLKYLTNFIYEKPQIAGTLSAQLKYKTEIYSNLSDYTLFSDDNIDFWMSLAISNNSKFNSYYFYSSTEYIDGLEKDWRFRKKSNKFLKYIK